jgi:hypothetical protein
MAQYMFEHDHLSAPNATSGDCWAALQDFANVLIGFKLFTVMTVDMATLTAQRVYTNNSDAYPVSGTKPITFDRWFDVVHRQQKIFVANTIAEIAEIFPDHEKIQLLGCGSVVNLPIIIDGGLVATINMLHEENYYTPSRVSLISRELTELALRTYLRVHGLTSATN